jgi:uncharacterized protein (DUF362 family)/Pyruvate/2-oxoacid:ferredoxin oxidoreductase delta subunit
MPRPEIVPKPSSEAMDLNPVVAIAKAGPSVEAAVKKAVALAGGMESVVNRGETILLKPNFVAPRDSATGATTDFRIIRAVAGEVRRCGGEPVLFETPALEFSRDTVFEVLGVRDFARENGIGLIDGPDDLVDVPVAGGRAFTSIRIPRVVRGAKIINLPKLKTHVSAALTCSLKNLIGLLPAAEKRRVHTRGIHASIADLHRVFHPAMTIVDGLTCMEGDGPTYGDHVEMGLVIAGNDMVAVDITCCRIIGLPWEKVSYLRRIAGRDAPAKIQLVGDSLESVARDFKIPRKGPLFQIAAALLYVLDVPFSKIFSQPLPQFLYGTGYIGTNPKIIRTKCNQCGDCRKACPVPDALEVETFRVKYRLCVRCLKCYEACPRDAIAVKGVSRPEHR